MNTSNIIVQVSPLDIDLIDGMNTRVESGLDEDSLRELADSIINSGQAFPIMLLKKTDGRYALIHGERRFKAALNFIIPKYPDFKLKATTVKSLPNESDLIINNLVGNSGVNLNPLEEGTAFKRLLNLGLKPTEIAERIGKSIGFVNGRVAIAEAPKVLLDEVAKGESTYTEVARVVTEAKSEARKGNKAIVKETDVIETRAKMRQEEEKMKRIVQEFVEFIEKDQEILKKYGSALVIIRSAFLKSSKEEKRAQRQERKSRKEGIIIQPSPKNSTQRNPLIPSNAYETDNIDNAMTL